MAAASRKEEEAGNPGQGRSGVRGVLSDSRDKIKKSRRAFSCRPSKQDWREQDSGCEGEAQPSPWDLGTVPLSAIDLHIALDVSFAVRMQTWAPQWTRLGSPATE